jgi:hypothetical protein
MTPPTGLTPRLKIVIPFYHTFEDAKPGLRALKTSGLDFVVQSVQGPCVHNNRNLGINGGQSAETWQSPPSGYTHYLFIDSDIGFTSSQVLLALRHDAPVVTLPYLGHEDDGSYQVGEIGSDYRITSKYTTRAVGLKHVTFTGAGFLLVKAEVLSMIAYPWFHHSMVTIGENSFSVGEDAIFSRKLSVAGIPILCDFDHPVQHRLRKMRDFDVSF